MEIWRQIIKRITKWNGTKRVKGTTELGDENLFCEALDDEFIKRIRKFAKAYALPNTMDGIEIVTAKLGDDAGVIGASVLARQNLGTTY